MLVTGFKIGVTLLEHNLKKLNDEVIDSAVEKWEQFDSKYNKNFKKYFNKSYKDLNKMRTILSNDVQELTHLFQETVLYEQYSDEHKKEKAISPYEFLNYVKTNKTVWITGHGGIGKSTLMKHTMLTILTDEKKSQSKIPIYIELRKYNHEKKERRTLISFIYEEMKLSKFELDFEMFEYMAKSGRFLFLFDAYDEITSDKSQLFLQEFEDFLKQYDENQVIISSRHMPKGHLENFIDLHELQTQGLSKDEAIRLIEKTKYDEERKKEFLSSLSESLYEEYETLACNPTLLLLMLTLFSTSTKFPKEKSTFLIKSFEELFDRHDGRKIAYSRDFKCKNLTKYQMMKVFSSFCYKTYFDTNGERDYFTEGYAKSCLERVIEQFTFLSSDKITVDDLLYDFRVCLCIIYKEGEKYYFVHNIFQEFFSAYYIYKSSDKVQRKFIEKYLFSSKSEKYYNSRLLRTTFEYLNELDDSEEQNVIKFNFLIPILEMIESQDNFKDYFSLIRRLRYRFEVSEFDFTMYPFFDVNEPFENVAYVSLVRLYLLSKNGISEPIRGEVQKIDRKNLEVFMKSSVFKSFLRPELLTKKMFEENSLELHRRKISINFSEEIDTINEDKNLVFLKRILEDSTIVEFNNELGSLLKKLEIEKKDWEEIDYV
ncbi:NACHT domain-containing protein [Vagococcus salmoninarum]|uniref:NACHT domain-containing protein n=1 Tax=Vagococcus salmoninarum TaxID=2739 RepID=UPI0028D497F4|nr:NACHT domain-containing protein [Vagococcus salmoninarum]